MRSPSARLAIASFTALSLALATAGAQSPPGGAPASKVDEARARYDRGIQLFDEGAYDASLIELQRAYELAPTYKILFNIGKVNRQLNDFAGALRAFERYLSEGGKEVIGTRRAEVEREITQLRSRVARLTIAVNVDDADVAVDDVSVGRSPLAQAVVVNAGRRKVTVTKTGRPVQSKVVTLAGSDAIKVDFDMGTDPALAAPVPPPPATSPTTAPPAASSAPTTTPPPARASERSFPWAGWLATGVLAVGATATGILAVGSKRDQQNTVDSPTATRSDLDDAHARTQRAAIASDILTGATLIVGGISLYLTLKRAPATDATGARDVKLGVSPGGFALRAGFLARRSPGGRESGESGESFMSRSGSASARRAPPTSPHLTISSVRRLGARIAT